MCNGQLIKSRSSDLHVDGGRKGMNEMPNTLIEPDIVKSGYAADRECQMIYLRQDVISAEYPDANPRLFQRRSTSRHRQS